jgi:hypothetical protein
LLIGTAGLETHLKIQGLTKRAVYHRRGRDGHRYEREQRCQQEREREERGDN